MMLHRRLLALAGRLGHSLALNVAVGLLAALCSVVQAVLAARVLAYLLTGGTLGATIPYLAGILGAVAVRSLLVWLGEVAAQHTAHRVKERVRLRLYERLLELGPGYPAGRPSGDVSATLVDGVEALEAYFSRYLPTAVIAILVPAGVLGYLATLDPLSAALIAVAIVVVLTGPRLWDRVLARTGEVHWRRYADLSADYIDATQGMATLKAFNATARVRRELSERAESLRQATMRHLAVSLVDTGITTYGMLAGPALAIGLGALRVAEGDLDLLTLLTVLTLSREALRPLGDLSKYWHAGYTGVTAAKEIETLLTTPSPIADAEKPVRVANLSPTITFDRVTFRYPGRDEPVLTGFSLHIGAGETVAVVGQSGVGKSTLAALLLRYFDPAAGRILVGGVDIRAIPVDQVREQFAFVAQDTYLFSGTVADNIRLGRPAASDEEVRRAAVAANADEFVAALPQSYETEVSERGLSLSGGQRQRLAVARALLKDAPILVLDEATSSVDSASETLIQEAVSRTSRGRTTLVIAHRLSTVREADRIVVLGRNGVTESGSHEALLESRGDYARLVSAQEEAR